MITIDPGMNTAIANWSLDQLRGNYASQPDISFFSVPASIKPEQERLEYAWDEFEKIIDHIWHARESKKVIMENTALWSGSLTSMTSGATGDLLMLTRLIGGYAQILYSMGIPYELITVESWKGQLPKDAVKRKIKRNHGWEFKNDHITDAVGIGLSRIYNWRETT